MASGIMAALAMPKMGMEESDDDGSQVQTEEIGRLIEAKDWSGFLALLDARYKDEESEPGVEIEINTGDRHGM